jgi:undecaprenyl-diphosphatase
MNWLDAFWLGVVEGLTEFLPVSSTGHLILLGVLLGHTDEAAKTLEVVIQLGAVLAVVVYYRARLASLVRGCLRGDRASLRLAGAIGVAFLPAALAGLAFHRVIKEHLFGPGSVGVALVAGGIVMLGVELARRGRDEPPPETTPAEDAALERMTFGKALVIGVAQCMTLGKALVIGVAQCFALWPGASRSMTTIVGGRLAGLGAREAADFSFLLAIPTLGAATVFELVKGGGALFASPSGAVSLVVGLVVSFVVALAVIAAFLRYLKRFGLAPFGVYRIVIGAVVLLLPILRAR